jgi:hypothetical protein
VTWELDAHRAARIGAARWGLRWPVHVNERLIEDEISQAAYTEGESAGAHAAYQQVGDEWWHEIFVKQTGCIREMLATLAHELEHARQCEALGPRTYSWLYSGFKPEQLDFKGGPARLAREGIELTARAAEDRWDELTEALTKEREA